MRVRKCERLQSALCVEAASSLRFIHEARLQASPHPTPPAATTYNLACSCDLDAPATDYNVTVSASNTEGEFEHDTFLEFLVLTFVACLR